MCVFFCHVGPYRRAQVSDSASKGLGSWMNSSQIIVNLHLIKDPMARERQIFRAPSERPQSRRITIERMAISLHSVTFFLRYMAAFVPDHGKSYKVDMTTLVHMAWQLRGVRSENASNERSPDNISLNKKLRSHGSVKFTKMHVFSFFT